MNKKKKNVNVKHRRNKERIRKLQQDSLLKAKPKPIAKKKVEESPAEKPAAKKPAAKKPAAKKPAAKKPAAKK